MRADRQRGGAAGRGDVGPRESFRLETKDAPETPSALRKERENAGFDGSVGCSRSTPDSPRTVSPAGKPRLWTRVCVKGSPLRDKGRSSKSGLAPPGLLHTHTHTHICTHPHTSTHLHTITNTPPDTHLHNILHTYRYTPTHPHNIPHKHTHHT